MVCMKDLDRLQHAVQILDGICDLMMMLESSTAKDLPDSVCIVFETAVETSVSLLDEVADAMVKEITEVRKQ